MEPEAKRLPMQFSLARLLAAVMVIAVCMGLCSFLVAALSDARTRSKVTSCKSNMKQLGLYLQTYVSRYGGDQYYPTLPPPALLAGVAIPGGTNGAFWSQLWLLPTPSRSVSRRPGDNGLYKCKVPGGPLTAMRLDYSGPNLANSLVFPGRKLSDRVLADAYIAGDLLIPGDCNHGNDATGPNYDYNGLRYDGSVQNIDPSRTAPGSEQFKYLSSTDAATTGVRTR